MFDTVVLPFTPAEMISTATGFLGLYGGWIALVLGVIFSPVLYGLALRLISYVSKKFATR